MRAARPSCLPGAVAASCLGQRSAQLLSRLPPPDGACLAGIATCFPRPTLLALALIACRLAQVQEQLQAELSRVRVATEAEARARAAEGSAREMLEMAKQVGSWGPWGAKQAAGGASHGASHVVQRTILASGMTCGRNGVAPCCGREEHRTWARAQCFWAAGTDQSPWCFPGAARSRVQALDAERRHAAEAAQQAGDAAREQAARAAALQEQLASRQRELADEKVGWGGWVRSTGSQV